MRCMYVTTLGDIMSQKARKHRWKCEQLLWQWLMMSILLYFSIWQVFFLSHLLFVLKLYPCKVKHHNKSKKLFRYPKRYPKCDIKNNLRNPNYFVVLSNIQAYLHDKFRFQKKFFWNQIKSFGYVFQTSERLFGYFMTLCQKRMSLYT